MKMQNILVPIDFSDNSRRALQAALELRRLSGGRLSLLHVIEPLVVAFGEALPGDLPTDQERLNTAEAEMEKLRQSLGAELVSETLVMEGTSWDSICEFANSRGIDLIVISSHGYKGLKRFVLGSTAERVVRHAECPVLVIKSRPDEAAGA